MDVGVNMDMDLDAGEGINGAHVAVSNKDVRFRQDGKDAGMTMMMDDGKAREAREAREARKDMHMRSGDVQGHDGKRGGEATRLGMETEMEMEF